MSALAWRVRRAGKGRRQREPGFAVPTALSWPEGQARRRRRGISPCS